MLAARLYAARDVRIEEVPTPVPARGEVLLRVRAVSICPSDWRLYLDGHAGGVVPGHPIIQGHEFSGDIAAVGEGVEGLPVGARVAVEPTWPCGQCDQCRAGRENTCRNVRFPSFPPQDGALAEYIACPADRVCALPDGVSYVEGALVEPLGVAIHAVRLGAPVAGETAVVLGAGVVGMCVALLARERGAGQLAVVEPVPGRRAWPRRIGIDPLAANHKALIADGVEADLVVECSGDGAALDQALSLCRPGGRVVVVGIPRDECVTFDMSVARRRELTVVFSRRSCNTLAEAVAAVASRRVDLSALPARHFPLAEAAAALASTGEHRAVLRSIVEP